MKKTFAVVSAVIIMAACLPVLSHAEENISVWDGASATEGWAADYNPDYNVSQTFEINSAADFIAFRNKVLEEGTNNPFYSKTVNLNCDIDLHNYNLRYGLGAWTDFSGQWYSTGCFFRGIFNGNGHVIKNITMDQTQPDKYLGTSDVNGAVGLFTTDSASINNLGVENVNIVLPSSSSTGGYFGGFASISYRTDVTGCYVKNASFSGGWADGVVARIGGFSAYHRQKDLKNSYVNGIDFTGLNSSLMGYTFIGGLVCTGDGNTNIVSCYSANVIKNLSGQGNFDRAVFILNPNNNGEGKAFLISLSEVYTDDPLHKGQGSEGSGYTGLLEDAVENLLETLGNGYRDLSEMGMKNNTGTDMENAVFCLACIDDMKLCGLNSRLVTIGRAETLADDIVLTIDLTDTQLGDNGYVQVIAYKGIDELIPILSVDRLER